MYVISYNKSDIQHFQGAPIKEKELAIYIYKKICTELDFNLKSNFKPNYGESTVTLMTMKNFEHEYLSLFEFGKENLIDDIISCYS